jgi:hypothetical protein
MFTSVSIFRNGPFTQMLMKSESPAVLHIRISIGPIRRIQCVFFSSQLLIILPNKHSDLLGQILQRQRRETCLLRRGYQYNSTWRMSLSFCLFLTMIHTSPQFPHQKN